MSRFYLALALLIALPRASAAQTPDPLVDGDRPPLGSSLTVDALGSLPASATVFLLLDTAVPDVIADRMDNGGLTTGDPVRVGAHGSTWTQTAYRVGDADITDPGVAGTPLLVPGVAEWDRIDVATGIMPPDVNAPGMAVGLVPRQPLRWIRWLDAFGSPASLNADGVAAKPPPITRLDYWAHGNLVAGGPLARGRANTFVSATWTRASLFERSSLTPLDASLGSLFLNVSAPSSAEDRLRFTGWLQRTRDPLEHHAALAQPTAAERRLAVHAQGSWERYSGSGTALRAFGSLTQRGRSIDLKPSPVVVIERLTDGPVTSLLDPGDGTDRLIQFGGRISRTIYTSANDSHDLLAGADLIRGFSSQQSAFTGLVGERVNGLPARAWDWTDPAAESRWHATTLTAFVSDTAALSSRLTINGGLRFETIRGYSTDAADAAVSWNDLYPRAGLHVALTSFWQIATFAQYGRYGHRLPLRDLAYGDPTAPTASIYRWTGGNLQLPASLGPLIQRIGPGSGGRANFSAIDPALTRPAMNEMVFGFESRPHPSAFARMAAVARREATLVGVVDVGVPESTYTTIGVRDTAIDRVGSDDDQLLLFYNRTPATFGADRYLLTNPVDHVATFVGVDFVGEVHAKRLFVIAGGTAGRSEGLSGNRGFGPLENDVAVLGEVFVDPNARTYAQGRVFTERGYTIKTAISYQFDHDVTFGLVGRYQDGQHFARMVVLDTLNQGPEAVRAFRNGRTRFTFSMTVDGRLQKGFTLGGRRFVATLDAFNIFNQALSVEELQVTGANARQETAVQPPRVIHVGVRIPF